MRRGDDAVSRNMLARPFSGCPQRLVAACVVVMTMLAMMVAAPSVSAESASSTPFASHVVNDAVSPSGTTIDLFDYWVQSYGANDETDSYDPSTGRWFNHTNSGINSGKQLKFTYGGESYQGAWSPLNHWTGSGNGPRFGLVNATLTDGYPTIAKGLVYDYNGNVTDGTQSLNYLFDPENTDQSSYKRAYPNVTGLLQLQDGYNVYDSTKNFATLNDKDVTGKSSYAMTLYDAPAVRSINNWNKIGQFFPFNSAKDVFSQNTNGSLSSNVQSRGANLNHYFGMHAKAEFVQPTDGMLNGDAMSFDFSGDDDVWVFIDGVLVGDVGGIHDASSLHINFQDGTVKVANDTGSRVYQTTTIRDMFKAAYGEDSDEFKAVEWSTSNPNTFADGGYHTLDFFYMERGNGDSNLKLKYNLANIPSNSLVKLDQQGNTVQGASFELYKAQSDYSYTAADLISKGVTNQDGTYTFTNYETGEPVNFADLARNGRGITHYVLKETNAPPGYRKSADIRLRYHLSPNGEGMLLCNENSNTWDSGAWSVGHETLTVANGSTVYDINGNAHNASTGKVFAVVLNRDRTSTGNLATDTWNGVTGSWRTGWSLSGTAVDDSMESIARLAKSDASEGTNYLHFFSRDSQGSLSTYISELPGDVRTYYYMLSGAERENALYAISVYYTTADSAADITAENTYRIDMNDEGTHEGQIMRMFGVQIAVTDVRNAPVVQKLDDAGNPVEGATIGLYAADQVSADGKTLLEGATPLQTCVTAHTDYPYPMKGSCMFAMKGSSQSGVADSGVNLGNGTYYIKEVSAPEGYEINNTLAKILVTDTGIFADAGEEGDGVTTMTHLGSLNQVLKQFAVNRSINRTLSDLDVTQLRCADEQCVTNNGWQESLDGENGKTVAVSWHGDFATGYYSLADQSTMTDDGFDNDTGWTYYRVTQSPDTSNGEYRGARFDLLNSNLAHLFTGGTVVRIHDQRKGSLTLTKTVTVGDGYDAPEDADTRAFRFRITLKADDAAKLQQDGKTDYYSGTISSAADGSANGSSDGATDGNASEQVVLKLRRDSATAKSGELERCVADGDTDAERCAQTEPVTLKNRQTLTIANITDGVEYAIQETELPTGYVLDQTKTTGMTGTIKRASGVSQATAVNLYQPNSVTLKAQDLIAVRKTVKGLPSDASGDYPFQFRLDAARGTPLPTCSTDERLADACTVSDVDANGNHALRKTLTYRSTSDGSQDMTLGDITFTKPGTYTYQLSEITPASGAAEGFNYSRAQYAVTIVVAVDDGELRVASVTLTRMLDDSGAMVADGTASDRVAEFTNEYSKDPRVVTFSATKNYTENGYPYQAGMFSATMSAVGSFVTADGVPDTVAALPTNAGDVPMPEGSGTDGVTVGFDEFRVANFPQISFNAGTGSHTYVYKVVEPAGTIGGTAMTYDSTEYYVFVAVTVTDGMVHANITYYRNIGGVLHEVKASNDGTNAIVFANTYHAAATSAVPQGSKTLTGRARTAKDSFSFTLKAADETTKDAVTAGNVTGANCPATGCTSDGVLAKATTTGTEAESGAAQSFQFGQLTFAKAGTYVFAITENIGNAGGVTYDGHVSTVTYMVADTDESGNHTGALRVIGVTYDNATASTDMDRANTTTAAFTNTYSALLRYAGFDVVKELNNDTYNATGTARNLYAGEFTFQISGVDEASQKRIAAATFANDRSFVNGAAAATASGTVHRATDVMANKLSDLTFNETDAGKTYEFKIVELAQHTNPNTGTTNTQPDADSKAPTAWGNKKDVKIDGVWCKQWVYYVRVTVKDNGDGTLGVASTAFCEKSDGGKRQIAQVDGNTKFGQKTILFTNSYEQAKSVSSKAAPLYKQLAGREWTDSGKDRFVFKLEKCNYSNKLGSFSDANNISCATDSGTLNTLPEPSAGMQVTVGKSDLVSTKAGDLASIDFGDFTFSKAGAYVYKVTEVSGTDATLTYATNIRYLRFRVEENQMKGTYTVIATTPGYDAPTATDENDGGAFVNVCRSAESLPLTGGTTTRNFLIGGSILGLLAVLAGWAIHEWRLHQQRKEQLLE